MFGLNAIFSPIIDFFTGAVEDTVVSSIAQEAIETAVTGSILGAVTALAEGEDILDGALRGAAIGALTGGVLSTISGITDSFTEPGNINIPSTDAPQATVPDSALSPEELTSPVEGTKMSTKTIKMAPPTATATQALTPSASVPPTSTAKTGGLLDFFKSDEGKEIAAKTASGILSSLVAPSEEEKAAAQYNARADADIRVLQAKEDMLREKMERNGPIEFAPYQKAISSTSRTANWWQSKLDPSASVANSVVNPTAKIQGVA